MKNLYKLVLMVALVFTAINAAAQEKAAETRVGELDFLKGQWLVRMEKVNEEGQWQELVSFNSTVEPTFKDNFLEENFSAQGPAGVTQYQLTFSYDRYNKVFRMSVKDDQFGHMDVLEGDFQNGNLVLDNRKVGFPVDGVTKFSRVTYADVSKQGFQVSMDISGEKEGTWIESFRMNYSRAPATN